MEGSARRDYEGSAGFQRSRKYHPSNVPWMWEHPVESLLSKERNPFLDGVSLRDMMRYYRCRTLRTPSRDCYWTRSRCRSRKEEQLIGWRSSLPAGDTRERNLSFGSDSRRDDRSVESLTNSRLRISESGTARFAPRPDLWSSGERVNKNDIILTADLSAIPQSIAFQNPLS